MSELTEQILLCALIGIAFVAFAGAVVFSSLRLKEEVPEEDREFLDPLPRLLRIVWPLVRLIDYCACRRIDDKYITGADETLRVSGLRYLMTPRQFVALCIVSMAGFTGALAIAFAAIGLHSWLCLLIGSAVGYCYPMVWLRDSLKRRQKAIVRALPIYLDFLTMSIEAGLNITGAISQAVAKGPPGPLKNELGLVLRDLRSNLTRSEALRRMDERLRVPQVSSFVSAVAQAERMGSSLGATFRHQAEQRRVERFQLAEKLAMQAPVKLIFPLVVFIFPTTFAVLMFPLVIKFMQSGVVL